jgi:hypothetical protein
LTGKPVYSQEYLDKLTAEGVSIVGMRLWGKKGEAQASSGVDQSCGIDAALAVLDSVRDFGVVYFLRELSEEIGLLGILRDAFPDIWQKVFALACYLVAWDKPIMYCDDWVESNAGLDVGCMSSQRTSDLLASFGCSERNSFYRAWHNLIREREYIALDITSVSSYSELIESCEWGYNRDGEDLPQVNICMLFGENSKLPVYQSIYSGSLGDVSTLRATIAEFAALTGNADIKIVMDKGFFSVKNINILLKSAEGEPTCRFLIAVPFSNKFAKDYVESERLWIDTIENVVLTSGAPMRGVRKPHDWDGKEISAYVFFDPDTGMKERNELFGYVASLARQAAIDPHNEKLASEYSKYLVVGKDGNEVTVSIREDIIAKALVTTGWFVLLSNCVEDPQAVHDIYRMKDVVEKGFMKYKNNLGLNRLRVHGDDRMQNKIFVAFIALIIASAIHETMRNKGIYKRMTFQRLILTLAKLKSATVNGKEVLRPMTKEQTDLFKAFGIRLPDYDTLKPAVPKKRGRKPKPRAAV